MPHYDAVDRDDELHQLITDVMYLKPDNPDGTAGEEYLHADLVEARVRISPLWASPTMSDDEITSPAVSVGGYPAAAKIRITNNKDRAHGLAHAELIIDQDEFNGRTTRQKMALIDHELTHLAVVRDREGHIKTHSDGSPVLRARLHDRQIGWFDRVAAYWGDDSYEVEQAERMFGRSDFREKYLPKWHQLLLPLMGETEEERDEAAMARGEAAPFRPEQTALEKEEAKGVSLTFSVNGEKGITLTPAQLKAAADRLHRMKGRKAIRGEDEGEGGDEDEQEDDRAAAMGLRVAAD